MPVNTTSPDNDDDDLFSKLNSDLARLDSEAEAILNSIRNETSETQSRTSSSRSSSETSSSTSSVISEDGEQAHENVCFPSSHHHDYDDDDDDELNEEILRLGSVVASLQHDLDVMSEMTEDATAASTRLSSPTATPTRTAVDHSCTDNSMEPLQSKRLCYDYFRVRSHSQQTTKLLVLTNIIVWSIVIVLGVHVRHGTLDGRGALPYLPHF